MTPQPDAPSEPVRRFEVTRVAAEAGWTEAFVVSECQTWMPGSYASQAAALFAASKLDADQMQEITEAINVAQQRPITIEDIRRVLYDH